MVSALFTRQSQMSVSSVESVYQHLAHSGGRWVLEPSPFLSSVSTLGTCCAWPSPDSLWGFLTAAVNSVSILLSLKWWVQKAVLSSYIHVLFLHLPYVFLEIRGLLIFHLQGVQWRLIDNATVETFRKFLLISHLNSCYNDLLHLWLSPAVSPTFQLNLSWLDGDFSMAGIMVSECLFPII